MRTAMQAASDASESSSPAKKRVTPGSCSGGVTATAFSSPLAVSTVPELSCCCCRDGGGDDDDKCLFSLPTAATFDSAVLANTSLPSSEKRLTSAVSYDEDDAAAADEDAALPWRNRWKECCRCSSDGSQSSGRTCCSRPQLSTSAQSCSDYLRLSQNGCRDKSTATLDEQRSLGPLIGVVSRVPPQRPPSGYSLQSLPSPPARLIPSRGGSLCGGSCCANNNYKNSFTISATAQRSVTAEKGVFWRSSATAAHSSCHSVAVAKAEVENATPCITTIVKPTTTDNTTPAEGTTPADSVVATCTAAAAVESGPLDIVQKSDGTGHDDDFYCMSVDYLWDIHISRLTAIYALQHAMVFSSSGGHPQVGQQLLAWFPALQQSHSDWPVEAATAGAIVAALFRPVKGEVSGRRPLVPPPPTEYMLGPWGELYSQLQAEREPLLIELQDPWVTTVWAWLLAIAEPAGSTLQAMRRSRTTTADGAASTRASLLGGGFLQLVFGLAPDSTLPHVNRLAARVCPGNVANTQNDQYAELRSSRLADLATDVSFLVVALYRAFWRARKAVVARLAGYGCSTTGSTGGYENSSAASAGAAVSSNTLLKSVAQAFADPRCRIDPHYMGKSLRRLQLKLRGLALWDQLREMTTVLAHVEMLFVLNGGGCTTSAVFQATAV